MSNATGNVVVPFRPRTAAVTAAGPPQVRQPRDEPTPQRAVRLARQLRDDTLAVRFLSHQHTIELTVRRRTKRAQSRLCQLLATAVAVGEFFADGVVVPVADYSVGVTAVERDGQTLWRVTIATHASMALSIQSAHRLIWQIGITQRSWPLRELHEHLPE